MARASIWNKFNRDDDFVAVRFLLVNGKPIAPGQPIDKSVFTTRRLRCLYEWRRIRKADAVVQETVAPAVMASAELPPVRKRGRPKRAAP